MEKTVHKENDDGKQYNAVKDDVIQDCMGPIGKFQYFVIILLYACNISTCFQTLSIVFIAPPVQYLCMDEIDNTTSGIPNKCPCDNPMYNTSIFEDTIIMSWNLICHRKWFMSLTQTVFMFGLLIGNITFGTLSDKYGRRATILGASILEVVAGVAASFVNDYWMFLILRFFIGCSVGAIMIITFVLVIEMTGINYRGLVSCLEKLPFNIGYLLMSLLAYYMRSWKMLQFAFSISPIIVVICFWLVPETPRWLLSVGKTEEAIQVLKKAAQMNNLPTNGIKEKVYHYQETKTRDDLKKATIMDIFRSKILRKNLIGIAINWFVCAFGFFGLSQYIGQLSGDIFVNNSISAGLTFIGTLLTYVGINLFRRKTAMLSLHIVTSISVLTIAFIPNEYELIVVILACIGNLGMFVLISVIYLYCSELFPTVVRNVAFGVVAMISRTGSMSAPFLVAYNSTIPWLPPLLFGVLPLFAASVCIFLPETKGRHLANTLTEDEEAYALMDIKKEENRRKT